MPYRRTENVVRKLTARREAILAAAQALAAESGMAAVQIRSEEHTSELQSRFDLVCRLLLEKKKRAVFRD